MTNPYKIEMDCLHDEIDDLQDLLWELNQMPNVEADRRQIRDQIHDLLTELAHLESARHAPEA